MKYIFILCAFSYFVPVLIHAETCKWKQNNPSNPLSCHVKTLYKLYKQIRSTDGKKNRQNLRYRIMRPDWYNHSFDNFNKRENNFETLNQNLVGIYFKICFSWKSIILYFWSLNLFDFVNSRVTGLEIVYLFKIKG